MREVELLFTFLELWEIRRENSYYMTYKIYMMVFWSLLNNKKKKKYLHHHCHKKKNDWNLKI